MMERIGILQAGKRVLLTIVIGLLCSLSLNADYKLVLTDVDGNQTEECVKSYSFSNNLESIAKQKGVANDVYSRDEVMTNKIFLGKPVYRKISTIPKLSPTYKWTVRAYVNPPTNIDKFISAHFVGIDYTGVDRDKDSVWKLHYELRGTAIGYTFGSSRRNMVENRDVIVEYTKTTDTANTSPNKFQSYLHYKLSSTTNDEVITKNMKNLGVQILEGYSYDASTNSCTKN